VNNVQILVYLFIISQSTCISIHDKMNERYRHGKKWSWLRLMHL